MNDKVQRTKAPRQHGELERCYLCGDAIEKRDRTNEHFVSRGFYPNAKLPNIAGLSLPAHGSCNASTHLDEEHVAHVLSFSRPFDGQPKDERWDRAVRALNNKNKTGYREAFFRDAIDLGPNSGAYLKLGDRSNWVLARICKALWFKRHHTGAGRRHRVVEFSDVEHRGPRHVRNDLFNETFEIPDVLVTRWDAHVESRKAISSSRCASTCSRCRQYPRRPRRATRFQT